MERNAARAGLVRRAETWPWCSLWQRAQQPRPDRWLLSAWPVLVVEEDWLAEVKRAHMEAELEALRRSAQGGQPYGNEVWAQRVARRLGLESTLRPRGRPRKQPAAKKGS